MRIIKIDKRKFRAVNGNSIFDLEHAPDEYVICVYIDDGQFQEMFSLGSVNRSLSKNGYRAISTINTGCIINDVVVIMDTHTNIEII